jgi:hypothetical protein
MPSSSRIRSIAVHGTALSQRHIIFTTLRWHMPARPGLFAKRPCAISAKFVKFRTAAKGKPEAPPPARRRSPTVRAHRHDSRLML